MSVYRLYFRPRNKSTDEGLEVFVKADNEHQAVVKALHELPTLNNFAAIMIDDIPNGVII